MKICLLLQGLSGQWQHFVFHPPAPFPPGRLSTTTEGAHINPVVLQCVLYSPYPLPQQYNGTRTKAKVIPITSSKGVDLGHISHDREGPGHATGWV